MRLIRVGVPFAAATLVAVAACLNGKAVQADPPNPDPDKLVCCELNGGHSITTAAQCQLSGGEAVDWELCLQTR